MLRLALRNVFRHRMRSIMVIAAIATGVIALLITEGFIRDVYYQFGEGLIHSQLGHVQVARKAYFDTGYRTPESFLLADSAALQQQIRQSPAVKEIMPRLDFSGLLNNGSSEITIIAEAVDLKQEATLSGGLRVLSGARLGANDKLGVMIGKGVADSLRLRPNDSVTVLAPTLDGAVNTIELKVVGVFASFSKDYDDRAIRLAIPTAQELLGTKDISRLIVLVKERDATDRSAADLRSRLASDRYEIRTWTELSDIYRNTVAAYEGQFGVIRVIILLLVILSVANVVNMSIFERTGEYGTMRALGNHGGFIAKMIYLETAVLGLVGALVGSIAGVLLAWLISAIGIPMPPPPNVYLGYLAEIRVSVGMVITAFLTGVISPLPACIWPAKKVREMPIVDALRESI